MSRVLSVAPVLPEHAHPQPEITATIGRLLTAEGPRRNLLERVHAGSGVRHRHLAIPLDTYSDLRDFGHSNDLFMSIGTDLAAEAVLTALRRAGLSPGDVDLLLFTTVTGVSAPSIDALLVERIGLRPDVRRMPSFGWGCAGGAAGLAAVHDHLQGHRDAVAVLLSVELCSLTLQLGDDSPANAVSSGLFGDGAAAVVVVGDDHPLAATGTGPEVVGSRSRVFPGTADQLGWTVGGSGFRVVLSPGVPEVVERHLAPEVAALLDQHGVQVDDVAAWVVHAGGPKILDAVQRCLRLPSDALDDSRACLAAAGNLSSASVLHVLARAMDRRPAPGSTGVVIAFGPGVAAELVLLRWPEGPC